MVVFDLLIFFFGILYRYLLVGLVYGLRKILSNEDNVRGVRGYFGVLRV